MTVDRDTVSKFIREGTASAEVLKEMSQDAKNEDLAVRTLAVFGRTFLFFFSSFFRYMFFVV